MPRVPGSVPADSKPVYEAFLADLQASGRAALLPAMRPAGSWSAGRTRPPGPGSPFAGGCAATCRPGRS